MKSRVRPPGFEPGSSAWEADVLARLDYGRIFNLIRDLSSKKED